MNVRKLIFAGSATALGLGLAGIPAVAVADDPPSKASPTQPTVTHSAGTFAVTLPGVASLSFGVDPTSGALTALTVTPTPGSDFVSGAPMSIEEGFQVLFTGTSGSQLLEVKVDRDENVTEVKAEVEPPPPAAQAGATPGEDRDGDRDADQGDDHGNDNGVDDDQDEASATTIPRAPIGGDHDGMDSHGGDGGQVPPHTTPGTNGDQSASSNSGPGGGASSSPGGPGDHGSDGSGSGSGSSPGGPGGSGGSDSSGSGH